MLEPADSESRVGEVFCHLSLGAMRTATAVLGELLRRDPNPFAYDLNVANRYGADARGAPLEIQVRLQTEAAIGGRSAGAFYPFVLWYLGQRDEAIRAAELFSRNEPDSIQADWPALMRAARQAPNPASE
jgi:hypothetical protein